MGSSQSLEFKNKWEPCRILNFWNFLQVYRDGNDGFDGGCEAAGDVERLCPTRDRVLRVWHSFHLVPKRYLPTGVIYKKAGIWADYARVHRRQSQRILDQCLGRNKGMVDREKSAATGCRVEFCRIK